MLVGFTGYQALKAKSALEQVAADFETLSGQLASGDESGARATLADAQRHADDARSSTRGPGWWLSARIPQIGPNVTAVASVAEVADTLASDVLPDVLDASRTLSPAAASAGERSHRPRAAPGDRSLRRACGDPAGPAGPAGPRHRHRAARAPDRRAGAGPRREDRGRLPARGPGVPRRTPPAGDARRRRDAPLPLHVPEQRRDPGQRRHPRRLRHADRRRRTGPARPSGRRRHARPLHEAAHAGDRRGEAALRRPRSGSSPRTSTSRPTSRGRPS